LMLEIRGACLESSARGVSITEAMLVLMAPGPQVLDEGLRVTSRRGPTHLDTHHWLHDEPALEWAITALAQETGAAVRPTIDPCPTTSTRSRCDARNSSPIP